MQFVLNRARAGDINTSGAYWTEEAIQAWKVIEVNTPVPVSEWKKRQEL